MSHDIYVNICNIVQYYSMTSCYDVLVTSLGSSPDSLYLVSSTRSIRRLHEDRISKEVNSPNVYIVVHSSTV